MIIDDLGKRLFEDFLGLQQGYQLPGLGLAIGTVERQGTAQHGLARGRSPYPASKAADRNR